MKRNVEHKYTFDIHSGLDYKVDITWGMLLSIVDKLQPNDRLINLTHRETEYSNWGAESWEENRICYIPVITVSRNEIETDDEYMTRIRKDEKFRLDSYEKGRLEYLRLKAIYEL
jgi:hypothetical protein